MHLVIGGKGLVGTALVEALHARNMPFVATARQTCDLLHPDPDTLPDGIKYLYLVAAMARFNNCEGNAQSWIVNVDSQIAIARRYKHDAFIVFVSSDTVEWIGVSAYARQKAAVESYIQSIDGAIVRPSKILPDKAAEFANLMIDVALKKRPGVTRWSG